MTASGLHWLFRQVRGQAVLVALVLVSSLLLTGAALAQPWLTGRLIDGGLLARDWHRLVLIALVMLALAVISSGLGWFNRRLYLRASSRVLFSLREAVFGHLQQLPPSAFARIGGGELLNRLSGDVSELQRFGVDVPLALVNAVFGLVGSVALMLSISLKLSLIAALLLPLEGLLLRLTRPWVERCARRIREQSGQIVAFLNDRLAAMKVIQSFAGEARDMDRLQALNRRYGELLLHQQLVTYLANGVPGLLLTASTAVCFIIGGADVIGGALSVGALVAFVGYLSRATGPVQTLLGLYTGCARAKVSLERIVELFALTPAVQTPTAPLALPPGRGGVQLQGVRFRYEPDSPWVFDGLDWTVPAGVKVGLIGPSGIGKSTLIDLLQRHYDPAAGTIRLDGVDLRQLELPVLRRSVAIVAQETTLFGGSIADNLRLAAPAASAHDLRAALAAAQLLADVEQWPAGLDTPIGWRGMQLSGGQRQRLALARALLQQPRLLILDEATSAVDLATEARIIAAVDRLFADCTRIVISHRRETLVGCQAVWMLSAGRLRSLPERDTG